jgi:hypothetical protein
MKIIQTIALHTYSLAEEIKTKAFQHRTSTDFTFEINVANKTC